MNLWVIVPAYNEAAGIEATLKALAEQDDRDFTLLVVDNASTDGTAEIARRHGVEVIVETRKGTGAASDTGMRHAIEHGATHLARTDADCLPRPDWVRNIRRAFGDGLEMVGGRLRPRTDEFPLKLWERRLIPFVIEVAATFGRFRPGNRDPRYRGPYVMMPGCSLAITADLYQRAGGFPRTAIEEVHEDRALVNRVRLLTSAYASRRDVVVFGSVRRLRAYGLVGTLAWYADHRHRPAVIDIR
ncbi:glycosyltransferase involved in cell wall biosynthesis [Streptosporangium becharense]|uniref:4,4'-diaponeurosporenoate glycosyltransferase n=1 Tax=Streptosporangium becharense TaxID=1816182 RepID=A0A7W9II90_9ACTN|nr:glycosyltransferase [Streptosporangium becharense]MBB2912632.1 glycosyltransferase involved in cell wall biosynthesis [Streptosporangium becharense]MBB5820539.1 glycosyltransferase involved in cell wall biosynthesis [Streptosporangium becharense]